MAVLDLGNLTNAEFVAQNKDKTVHSIPVGEVEFFLAQNGLANRNAITGSWEGVLPNAIDSLPDLALLFQHLNGPRNVTIDTTDTAWAGLCGSLLDSLLGAGVLVQSQVDAFIALGGGYAYIGLDEAYVQSFREEQAAEEAARIADELAAKAYSDWSALYWEGHNSTVAPVLDSGSVDNAALVAALRSLADSLEGA